MFNPTYSQIIAPELYNELIAKHVYIPEADRVIVKIVAAHTGDEPAEVVEFGCGPARILPLLRKIKSINLTGIDHDKTFVEYAKAKIRELELRVSVLEADATIYQHDGGIDVAVSQGFHHHVPKGEQTQNYLQNVYNQLRSGGIYVVGDEFLPHYKTAEQRLRRAVLWYSHVIAHALRGQHEQVAVEEAKTLLDDLAEGTEESVEKNEAQINYILHGVEHVDYDGNAVHLRKQNEKEIDAFLWGMTLIRSQPSENTPSMNLSRGDFKVCHSVFVQEVEVVGFKVIGVKTIGPIATIGGMAVYTLLKE